LLAAGLYYKQQFVVAPLAIELCLLLERRFRLAAEFAAWLGFAGLSLLTVFELLVFPHQAFLLHFISYNALPFTWQVGRLRLLGTGVVLLVPAGVALKYLRTYPNKLLSCYLGLAALLLLVTVLKAGATVNYFFEIVLVLSPGFAALLVRAMAKPLDTIPLIFYLAVAVLAAQLSGVPMSIAHQEHFVEDRSVQAFLREDFRPGTPAVSLFTGDLLRAGLATPITDLYQYTWLICKGTLSDRDLLMELRSRRFGVVLLTNDLESEAGAHDPFNICLTEPLHQAIVKNYRLAISFRFHTAEGDRYYAWVPRH
jgi:hypothetical protein